MTTEPEIRPRRLPAIAAILAVALAMAYLFSIWDVPQFREPVIDEWSYHTKALGLLNGTWPGKKVFYQDPLYPYFLAAVYKMTGVSGALSRNRVVVVKLLQAFMLGLHVLLIFGITRRVFGRGAARAASLMAAFYKPLYFFAGILTKEILSLILVEISLYTLVNEWKKRGPGLFLSGVALGLACLTRANLMLMVPVWGAWVLFSEWRGRGFPRALGATLLFAAGAGLAISPATIHNRRAGDFVLITSQGGQNFYIGNHDGNRTGTYKAPPFLRAHPRFEEIDFINAAKGRRGFALPPSQVSRLWYERSFEYAREKPGEFWGNMGLKAALFFNDFEISDNVNYYFYKERFAWPLRLPLPGWGVAAALGLFGWLALLFMGDRRPSCAWPVMLFLPVYAASIVAYYIFGRYRLPALAALLPLSAFGLKALWDGFIAGRRGKLFPRVILLCGIGLFAYWPLQKPHFDVAYYMLGNGYFRQGRYAEAERELKQAMLLRPETLSYILNYGLSIYQQGRYGEAAEVFEHAVALYPNNPRARENLGNAYLYLKRYEDAVAQYDYAIAGGQITPPLLTRMAMAFRELGKNDEARFTLQKALKLNPDYRPAIEQLRRTQVP